MRYYAQPHKVYITLYMNDEEIHTKVKLLLTESIPFNKYLAIVIISTTTTKEPIYLHHVPTCNVM